MSIIEITNTIIIIIKIRKNLMPYDWNWNEWILLPGVSLAKNRIILFELTTTWLKKLYKDSKFWPMI